jgi:hypothetical protein
MGENLTLNPREEHSLRVFENGLLRRIFGSEQEEVIIGWRKLQNSMKLSNLYYSQNSITVIKSRMLRSTGHVARMEMKTTQESEDLKGRESLKYIGADGGYWTIRMHV